MNTKPCDARFDADDVATVADNEVVALDAVIAKLAAEHPDLPISRIEAMILDEHDAQTGGAPVAVPCEVVDGVEELIRQNTGGAPQA